VVPRVLKEQLIGHLIAAEGHAVDLMEVQLQSAVAAGVAWHCSSGSSRNSSSSNVRASVLLRCNRLLP
jgi:hypothetical protein